MQQIPSTDERILSAFLKLAAERSFDAVTTREVASEAGVNPVTLFRRFGDKNKLALEAIRRYSPAETLRSRDPGVDPSRAADGIVDCLMYLNDILVGHRQIPWLRLLVKQMSQIPEVQAEQRAILDAVYGYVRRALDQAAPAIRPEVDRHVAALQLVGLLKFARQAEELQFARQEQPKDLREMFSAAVRPLLREM
ncbi:MAG: TetR/AcrR family transcriptional regulator [Symbiobacteriia bacterium]